MFPMCRGSRALCLSKDIAAMTMSGVAKFVSAGGILGAAAGAWNCGVIGARDKRVGCGLQEATITVAKIDL
jgi:hypothetical protein